MAQIINNPIPPDPLPPPQFGGGSLINIQTEPQDIKGQFSSNIGFDLTKYSYFPPQWNEVPGYEEQWSAEDQESTRVFQGPWGLRKAFIDYMVGYAGNLNGLLTRVTPAQHPEYYWQYAVDAKPLTGQGVWFENPNVFARDADGALIPNPFNGDPSIHLRMIAFADYSTGSDSNSCKVAVTYRALPYEVRTDDEIQAIDGSAPGVAPELARYVERVENYASKSLPIPGWQVMFQDPSAPASINGALINQTGVNLLLQYREAEYIWNQVPDVPERGIAACLGKVNKFTFDAAVSIGKNSVGGAMEGDGYAPGTVMCLGAHKKRIPRNVSGRVSWRIAYRFLVNPNGWNKFPAQDGGFYTGVRVDASGKPGGPVFLAEDFKKLFRMPGVFNYQ